MNTIEVRVCQKREISDMGYYSYDDESFIYDNENYVNVWVDGSCLGNGRPGARAGYGVFFNWQHEL